MLLRQSDVVSQFGFPSRRNQQLPGRARLSRKVLHQVAATMEVIAGKCVALEVPDASDPTSTLMSVETSNSKPTINTMSSVKVIKPLIQRRSSLPDELELEGQQSMSKEEEVASADCENSAEQPTADAGVYSGETSPGPARSPPSDLEDGLGAMATSLALPIVSSPTQSSNHIPLKKRKMITDAPFAATVVTAALSSPSVSPIDEEPPVAPQLGLGHRVPKLPAKLSVSSSSDVLSPPPSVGTSKAASKGKTLIVDL